MMKARLVKRDLHKTTLQEESAPATPPSGREITQEVRGWLRSRRERLERAAESPKEAFEALFRCGSPERSI